MYEREFDRVASVTVWLLDSEDIMPVSYVATLMSYVATLMSYIATLMSYVATLVSYVAVCQRRQQQRRHQQRRH